ncbi:hypothetical protein [Paraburkholderia humisilvae]|uniref:Uracil-DNA glycosylase-like domain-containing protein n=1 Tax=Paraburkholderia humisilvae TaxID=627669 RepID=A0A6J5DIL7_9BURK|nr:hypothetical protein [Paraburkholderia humisilvae]CAB3754090.1 hypothetical protein LMG29542_02245 [Paraburkholderia humisilvae]
MDSLKAFADELRKMAKPGEPVRPFVCDGSPLDCSVFIVGNNRAARLASEFWTYWDDSSGVDKARFMSEYGDYRRSRGRPEIAHSRRALEVLVKSCAPLRCLETNVFGVSTDTRDELLAAPAQGVCILPYLVDTIKPRWIIAHGAIAGKAVSAYEASATIIRLPDLRKCAHADLRRIGRRIVDSMLQEGKSGHPGAALTAQLGNTAPDNVGNPEADVPERRLGDALDMLGRGVSGDARYRNSIVQSILSVARSYQDEELAAACEREIERSCLAGR